MKKTVEKILVIEPQCSGFMHAHFNAAWIRSLQLAFPSAKITFLSEKEHFSCVKEYLRAETRREIEFSELKAPLKHTVTNWGRLFYEYSWVKLLFDFAENQNPEVIYILMINNMSLIMLKLFLFFKKASFRVFAVCHSLGVFSIRLSRKPWNNVVDFRRVLSLPHPPKLSYIVLGESIYTNLSAYKSEWKDWFIPIEHPFFWFNNGKSNEFAKDEQIIRFGHFGWWCIDGFRTFVNLVSQIMENEYGRKVEFWLIGHVPITFKKEKLCQGLIKGVSFKPLSFEEYNKRAMDITYSVWTNNPSNYSWSASATFLDTLSFIKPGFFLRNSFIEHSFRKMGDIGYLCEDEERLKDEIFKVIRDFPEERYKRQCENIIAGRKLFEPEQIAENIRNKIVL